LIDSSQDLNTSKITIKKESISSKNNYSLLGKKKSTIINDKLNLSRNNSISDNSSKISKHIIRNNNANSLQRNNLSLFPILELDEKKGEIYS